MAVGKNYRVGFWDSCLQVSDGGGCAEISHAPFVAHKGRRQQKVSRLWWLVGRAGWWALDPFPCNISQEEEMFYAARRRGRADPR